MPTLLLVYTDIQRLCPKCKGDIQPYMTIKKKQIQVISCNEKRGCPVPAGENSARVQGSDREESMEGGGEGTRR